MPTLSVEGLQARLMKVLLIAVVVKLSGTLGAMLSAGS